MALVAVKLPLTVVTVIVAVPVATPVTRPVELTVATAVLLEVQVTFLLDAFDGDTVAVSCCVWFAKIDAVVGLTVTPVVATTVTVMAEVAVFPPSCVVTVIVAVPAAMPLTSPEELTVATEALLDDHVTFLLVAFAGATVAVSWVLLFTATLAVVGLTVTPVTATGAPVVQLKVTADAAGIA